MKVSVLVASYGRPSELGRCLRSVFAQVCGGIDVEVIVFDGAPTARVRDALAATTEGRGIQWMSPKGDPGIVGARNALVEKASGDFLILLDDDAYLGREDCIETVARAFSENPEVGILAAKITDQLESGTRLFVPFPRRALRKSPDLLDSPRRVSYFVGPLYAIRRASMKDIGGYEPTLFFGEEELDLSYRAVAKGWEILYVPNLVGHHKRPIGEPSRRNPSRMYLRARNRCYLAHTYLPFLPRVSYLAIWLSVLGVQSLRDRNFRDFVHGLRDAWRARREWPRSTLSPAAVNYLRSNFGRLWY